MVVKRFIICAASLAVFSRGAHLPPGVESLEAVRKEKIRDDAWLSNLVLCNMTICAEHDSMEGLPFQSLHLLDVVQRVPVIDEFTAQMLKVTEEYLLGDDDQNLKARSLPSETKVGLLERALKHLGTIANFLLSDEIWPLWQDNFNAREAVKFTNFYHLAKRSPGTPLEYDRVCEDRQEWYQIRKEEDARKQYDAPWFEKFNNISIA